RPVELEIDGRDIALLRLDPFVLVRLVVVLLVERAEGAAARITITGREQSQRGQQQEGARGSSQACHVVGRRTRGFSRLLQIAGNGCGAGRGPPKPAKTVRSKRPWSSAESHAALATPASSRLRSHWPVPSRCRARPRPRRPTVRLHRRPSWSRRS